MKKIFYFLFISLVIPSVMNAQETTATNAQKPMNDETERSWHDYGLSADFDNDTYGLRIGSALGEVGYTSTSISLGLGEYTSYSFTWGLGLHGATTGSEDFVIKGAIYPYIGYGSFQTPKLTASGKMEKENEGKFLYGAAANLCAAIHLFTTEKGNPHYLTIGYYIAAPEFKTQGMFKNGSWCIGLSCKM